MMKRYIAAISLLFAVITLWADPTFNVGKTSVKDSVQTVSSASNIEKASKLTDDQLKDKADKAYHAEKYELAGHVYNQLVSRGQNADVYYNLGNCYYRLDDIAHAILWYERALLLNPGDEDIRVNLQLAQSKTVDKIIPEEDLFFVRWYHSLLNQQSVSGWVWTGVTFFAIMLICLLLFFFGQQLALRKSGFYIAILCFILVLFSNLFAWQQRCRQQQHNRAVVLQNSVIIKSTPSDAGTDLFLLHNGTELQILDNSMKQWCQIRLSNGKEGWIPTSAIEAI